jgi:peptidoglycan/xylan/chitin deacetylase (PgdA/CDA1 family)
LNRLGFVLSSRGLKNTVDRAVQIGTRFGITAARMETRLVAYADLVGEYGGAPSLPITAVVLDRNPQVARRLLEAGVELCVHGLVHTDMARLPAEIQEDHIRRAVDIFASHGIAFEGFRSPYLKFNRATLLAVEKVGFRYDSNLPFYWEPPEALKSVGPEEADGLRRGLRFYGPVKFPAERSLPRYVGDIIEIPVSLPDDEIMLDRMGLPVSRIGDAWTEMAGQALARRELLTLQLHPERILHLEAALRRVLEFARSGSSFWLAKMKEIAAWWDARTRAAVEVVPSDEGTYQVTLSGPAGLGLVALEPLSGLVLDIKDGRSVRSPARPVIGVPESAPEVLRRNIRELGYFFEITADRDLVNLYVDRDVEPAGLEKLIALCPKPLLADTRWPAPYKAAITVTGDIDCLTLGDFLRRLREG